MRVRRDLIAKVLKAKEIEEAVFVGHSYGAAITAMICQRHERLVSRAILISHPVIVGRKPPWYLRNGFGARILFWMVRGLISAPDKFRGISEKAVHVDGVLTDELSEFYRNSMLVEGFSDAFFGYAKALSSGGENSIPYTEISAATLVIAGENDQIFSLRDCNKVAGKFGTLSSKSSPNAGTVHPRKARLRCSV